MRGDVPSPTILTISRNHNDLFPYLPDGHDRRHMNNLSHSSYKEDPRDPH